MVPKISPEDFDIANAYLEHGTAEEAAFQLSIPRDLVHKTLAKDNIREYVNSVYLDQGYRNRKKLADLLDKIIDSKIEEAQESGMYTSKDLLDVIALVHKMKMDELKASAPAAQTSVTVTNNNMGGNYGRLVEKLMNDPGVS